MEGLRRLAQQSREGTSAFLAKRVIDLLFSIRVIVVIAVTAVTSTPRDGEPTGPLRPEQQKALEADEARGCRPPMKERETSRDAAFGEHEVQHDLKGVVTGRRRCK